MFIARLSRFFEKSGISIIIGHLACHKNRRISNVFYIISFPLHTCQHNLYLRTSTPTTHIGLRTSTSVAYIGLRTSTPMTHI